MKILVLIGGLLGLAFTAVCAPPERISGSMVDLQRVTLRGNVRAEALAGVDLGGVEPWMELSSMQLVLKPSGPQAAELSKLLEEQRDPASPEYRQWLTPEEFGERFGLSESDLGKITSWLEAEGFTVERVARARNWIAFSGTAAAVSLAFRTEIHRYSAGHETHFANAAEPSIPAALQGVVESVRGLDDFRPLAPRHIKRAPDYTSSSGAHYLAPQDLAVIYDIAPLYQAGFNGAGQTLVVVGQTDIKLSDIQAFRGQFGLPSNVPQVVLYGSDPGSSSGDQMEADLDLEWAGAVARNATIVYANSQNVFDSLQYAIDQDLGTVITMSYGACEAGNPASARSIAQQANAQGITWINASGDSGAAGCDPQGTSEATEGPSVTFPADIPEVTAVGGTEFAETSNTSWGTVNANYGSATSYLPEKAWNDTALGQGIEASGGGASAIFSKPWWQSGPGVPNDGARDVPDVSLSASAAHDGYLVYAEGEFYVVGGTSAATPSFAGMITLLIQYLVAKGIQAKAGLGNINPSLYSLAQTATGVFHDITSGNNIVPCKTGTKGCTSSSFGYAAGAGYDPVTGLGSVDVNNLVTKWTSVPAGVGTTLTLSPSPASISRTGSTQLTAKVAAVSGSSAPPGTVAFTTGGQALGSAVLTAPATGTVASAGLTVEGSSLLAGSNTINAVYMASGSFAGSSGSAVVTVASTAVGTTTTVTASPATMASSATTQLVATVKAASGSTAPTGSMSFLLGSTTLGTVVVAGSSASLTVKGSSLATGSNSITASYKATGNFTNSSGSVSVTVTAPVVATSISAAASPAIIAPGGTTQISATVKATSGVPAGSVSFALGNTSLGVVPLSNSGAVLTVKGSSLAIGSNKITVSYTATGNFSSSSSSVTVTVSAPTVTTTTSVAANPTSIASTASTKITATVRATSGTAAPTGSVTFSLGRTVLGTVALVGSAATLTLKGSSLAVGGNSVTATYAGASGFAPSSGSATVTVSPLR